MSTEARRNFAVPLEVRIRLPDGTELREWAVNLSAGGVCLHLSEPLASTEGLLLSFDLPDLPIREVAAHVVWEASERPNNRFRETGLSFEGLSNQKLEALREWASQPTNRRR